MEIKFSPELLTILSYARDEAMRTGHYGIGEDHLALGLLRHRDNDACRALAACGIDPDALKKAVDEQIFADRPVPWQDQGLVRPTRGAAALLSAAAYEALKHGQTRIQSSHFLLALVRADRPAAAKLLRGQGLDYDRLCALMREQRFILPRQAQESTLPRVEDLLGPLGEQLTRLYGDAQAPTQMYS